MGSMGDYKNKECLHCQRLLGTKPDIQKNGVQPTSLVWYLKITSNCKYFLIRWYDSNIFLIQVILLICFYNTFGKSPLRKIWDYCRMRSFWSKLHILTHNYILKRKVASKVPVLKNSTVSGMEHVQMSFIHTISSSLCCEIYLAYWYLRKMLAISP